MIQVSTAGPFPPATSTFKGVRGALQLQAEDSVKAANTKMHRGIEDGQGGKRKTEGVLGSFKSRGRRSVQELRMTEGLTTTS